MEPAKSAEPIRRPANRRELILDAAVDLFDERGYHATGVDDIGKAVDVSGPAIYRHFSSKEDILLEAIRLAASRVRINNERALNNASNPREILEGFIRAYARVAIEQSSLIAVWTSEVRHLSPERRAPIMRRIRNWRDEWNQQLLLLRPELDVNDARVIVSGAQGLITAIATSQLDFATEQLEDQITALALAVLQAPIAIPRPSRS